MRPLQHEKADFVIEEMRNYVSYEPKMILQYTFPNPVSWNR